MLNCLQLEGTVISLGSYFIASSLSIVALQSPLAAGAASAVFSAVAASDAAVAASDAAVAASDAAVAASDAAVAASDAAVAASDAAAGVEEAAGAAGFESQSDKDKAAAAIKDRYIFIIQFPQMES